MSDETHAEMLARAQDIDCRIPDGRGGTLYHYGHCLCAANVRELLGKKTAQVAGITVTLPDPTPSEHSGGSK